VKIDRFCTFATILPEGRSAKLKPAAGARLRSGEQREFLVERPKRRRTIERIWGRARLDLLENRECSRRPDSVARAAPA
jgi:hypothetical protein